MIHPRATVVEAVPAGSRMLVACDVGGGELRPGMVLAVPARREAWRVVGVAGAAPDLYVRGRRGLARVPLRAGQDLAVGDVPCGATRAEVTADR